MCGPNATSNVGICCCTDPDCGIACCNEILLSTWNSPTIQADSGPTIMTDERIAAIITITKRRKYYGTSWVAFRILQTSWWRSRPILDWYIPRPNSPVSCAAMHAWGSTTSKVIMITVISRFGWTSLSWMKIDFEQLDRREIRYN